jgi:hypothetical protein
MKAGSIAEDTPSAQRPEPFHYAKKLGFSQLGNFERVFMWLSGGRECTRRGNLMRRRSFRSEFRRIASILGTSTLHQSRIQSGILWATPLASNHAICGFRDEWPEQPGTKRHSSKLRSLEELADETDS